jgi:hypothetical protein
MVQQTTTESTLLQARNRKRKRGQPINHTVCDPGFEDEE